MALSPSPSRRLPCISAAYLQPRGTTRNGSHILANQTDGLTAQAGKREAESPISREAEHGVLRQVERVRWLARDYVKPRLVIIHDTAIASFDWL